jgi:hypothetical protein
VTELAAALIGRQLLTVNGSRVGRIIAVVHRPGSADVLVEQRFWLLRRRSYRFRLDEIEQRPDGGVLLRRRTEIARAFDAGMPGEVAAGGR